MPHSLPILREKVKIAAWLSHPRLRNILAAIIAFFSATQLGLHFWPSSALVYGIRIDYLSPTLYFLDVLILLYLLLKHETVKLNRWYVIPILLTTLLFSLNAFATLSWSLHLLLYLAFILSLTRANLKIVSQALIFSIIFQIGLALVQVVLGHSLGGFMYYFGERMVAVGSPAVATATIMGSVVLRAYATFSHPNILAGWLVISFLIFQRLYKNTWQQCTVLTLTATGVLLTHSRAGALALFGVIIPFYCIKNLRWRLIYLTLALTLSWSLSFFTPPRTDLSNLERESLQTISSQIITQYPIFGTGAQGSLSAYPSIDPNVRLLQPDHNSATLLLSWFGFSGLLALVYLARHVNLRFAPLISLLPLFLFDHYLVTSPQGLFVVLLYLKTISTLN